MKINIKNSFLKILWLVIIIMVIGVSYAYFSSTLYVNGVSKLSGNFEVVFGSANIINPSELETVSISDDGLDLSFNVKLALPGESDVIEYTIVNNGTIDAVIEELVVTSSVDEDVVFECSSIAGDLLSGESLSGTITVTWLTESVSAQKDVSFDAKVIANQKVS